MGGEEPVTEESKTLCDRASKNQLRCSPDASRLQPALGVPYEANSR